MCLPLPRMCTNIYMHVYLSSMQAVSVMFGCWGTYLQQGGGLYKEVVHMECHGGTMHGVSLSVEFYSMLLQTSENSIKERKLLKHYSTIIASLCELCIW